MSSAPTYTDQHFAGQSKTILSKGQQLTSALAPNTVQVWPGGNTFTSIQAAINSITAAGPQVQYQVVAGPGTYNEYVTMKDYVYIIGSGIGKTIITAAGQQTPFSGVVNSASNCGIGDLSIIATGGGWGVWPIGIKICGSGSFHISGVAITSSDSNIGGDNVRGITNNTGSNTGKVIIGSSTIQTSAVTNSVATGIECFGNGSTGGFTLFIELTAIQSQGAESFGMTLAVGASATLEDSKIAGTVWALDNSDGMSPIMADQCTITGPVSPGVTVNN
jgi:hypothetical protein